MKTFFTFTSYNPWWEDDLVEQFENEDNEVPVIVRQAIVLADTLPCEKVDFPWHGYSEKDFEHLHKKMVKSLKSAIDCKSKKDVIRFKKRNKDVYNAYFLKPIQILQENSSVGDGRHRIYMAQRLNSVIPIWEIAYVPKRSLTLEDYRRKMAWGEWRFLDE